MQSQQTNAEQSQKKEYISPGNVNDVIAEEKKHIGLDEKEQPKGLAISGGGIRSASFGLGVLQALVANNQLKRMDYLSTVSGGGYIGSALTWALSMKKGKNEEDEEESGENKKDSSEFRYGTKPDNFPFGKRKAKPTRMDKGSPNAFLDYIRQHSSYLTPTHELDIVSLAAVAVRGIFISLLVYFGLIVIAMTLCIRAGFFDSNFFNHGFSTLFEVEGPGFPLTGFFFPLAILCLAIYLVFGLLYSVGTFFLSNSVNSYKLFIWGQIRNGILWKFGLSVALVGTLPYIIGWLQQINMAIEAATGSTLIGSAVGLWQYVKAQRNEKSSGSFSGLIIVIGVFALLYGLLLSAYLVSAGFFIDYEQRFYFLLASGIIIFLAVMVNLNMVGPHRIWRNRLMEAFMPNPEAIEKNQWKPATKADTAFIHQMCQGANKRPYHIVNTNVILTNAKEVKYAGRGGDNFILSPIYCGSDSTGWRLSTEYHTSKAKGGITLATAMATSAAALNPNAGVAGEGVTRNTLVSILLSFMNLRLGYWANNPGKSSSFRRPPNFLRPGLLTEIFRRGFDEKSRRVQLSDGGHFENLALYELIRRKAELVVLSDGGADDQFNFDDLANAVEKARVDFGAKIVFRKNCGLDAILPGTAKKDGSNDAFIDKYAIAERGFAIADIHYENGMKGVLVYIKLAMVSGLPTDLYSYKGVHPEFPHQSTADQFFDEKQFEAYRELGYNITWQMMAHPESNKTEKLEQTAQFEKMSREEKRAMLIDDKHTTRLFPITDPNVN